MENSFNKSAALLNKKVVVLGGSSGIGLATAKAAAREGAELTIVSGNQQRIDAALKELPSTAKGFAVDLSKEENIKEFFAGMYKFDHLVYTAGENLRLYTVEETDLDTARQFFNTRFWGALAAVKYATPLINEGGSISLTSGIASMRPGKGWSIASSICGAMEALTRALAVELAPVRVNAVVPGVIKTNLWSSMSDEDREDLFNATANALPVQRAGEADDIADAFLYLIKQSFGTGQCLIIDGGAVLV